MPEAVPFCARCWRRMRHAEVRRWRPGAWREPFVSPDAFDLIGGVSSCPIHGLDAEAVLRDVPAIPAGITGTREAAQ